MPAAPDPRRLLRLARKLLRDPLARAYIQQELARHFAEKEKTEDRIEKLYQELVRLREESERKWAEWQEEKKRNEARWQQLKEELERKWRELKAESDQRWEEMDQRWRELKAESDQRWEANLRKWEENEKRWEENQRRWEENERRWQENERRWEENERRWQENSKHLERLYEEIKRLDKKIHTSITAIGARWGVATEHSFREGLRGFLEQDYGLTIQRYVQQDPEGIVHGFPATVEIDVVVHNGKVYLAEIKSSTSVNDMYAFLRKVAFYEKKEACKVTRKMVISPMVEPKAWEVAKSMGIEVYSYPSKEEIEGTVFSGG
jgi:hypothetical protein